MSADPPNRCASRSEKYCRHTAHPGCDRAEDERSSHRARSRAVIPYVQAWAFLTRSPRPTTATTTRAGHSATSANEPDTMAALTLHQRSLSTGEPFASAKRTMRLPPTPFMTLSSTKPIRLASLRMRKGLTTGAASNGEGVAGVDGYRRSLMACSIVCFAL